MLPLIFNFALIVLVTCLTYKYFTLKEKLIPVDDRLAVYIESFATIIDKFEAYENSHAHKMVQVAKAIAKEKNMSEEEIAVLHYTCLLHDIGQLMLPRELFKSSKKLDEDQIFLLRTHPLLGEIELRNAELPFDAVPVMIRWHHEKWDGSGYPDGLKGTEIPLISRIITLADTISAMSSSRPYRNKVFKNDEILRELDCQAALQFDPELVEIYKRINANLNLKGDTK